jgi:hypothetical protein
MTPAALALALRGHQELVSEKLALRQQLSTVKRTTARPRRRGSGFGPHRRMLDLLSVIGRGEEA